MKTLVQIDLSNAKNVQDYEALLRKRLKKLGYHLSKGETAKSGPRYIELLRKPKPRGFKITEIESGSTVAGKKFDLTIEQVEKFWLQKYEKWCIEQQEIKRQKLEEKMSAGSRLGRTRYGRPKFSF